MVRRYSLSPRNSSKELELAIVASAIATLRRRASILRQRANQRIAILNGEPPVVVDSEARHKFNLAADFAAIANELESGI